MDRRVRSILELLDGEWHREICVPDLAHRVGLGPSRLEHLFNAHAKMAIRDFVRERRLAKAAELLITTEDRISSICTRIGFHDVSNFNHAFKKRFGMAPREYRRVRGDEVSRSHQEKAGNTKV